MALYNILLVFAWQIHKMF